MKTSPPQGNLSETGICEILAGLCRERQTGVLRSAGNGPEKSIYLQDGQIVFAASRDPDDRLGELLLTRGAITRAQLEKASALVGPGKRLGTILVELGFLPAADLPRWVREQVKEIIYSLFSFTEGTYRFEPGPFPSSEAIPLKISGTEVFLSGLRRVEKWSLLRRGAGEIRIPYRLSAVYREVLRDIALSEEEKELLSKLELRAMTMEEAAVKSTLSTLRVYQLFYALRVVGLLTVADPELPVVNPGPASSPPSPPVESQSPSPTPPAPLNPPAGDSEAGARTVILKMPLEGPLGREVSRGSPQAPRVSPTEERPRAGGDFAGGDVGTLANAAASVSSTIRPSAKANQSAGNDPAGSRAAPAKTVGNDSSPPRPAPGGIAAVNDSSAAVSANTEPDIAKARRKVEYRVIRLEAEKLNGNGTQRLEDLLRTWTQKGYHLAGVVPGTSSRIFGGPPPTFFIFSRD